MPKNREYHFVVSYDTFTKSWTVQPDVSINFDNGDVWLPEEDEWVQNLCESDEEVAVTNAIALIMREAKPVEVKEVN
jgi:hypothetical protein